MLTDYIVFCVHVFVVVLVDAISHVPQHTRALVMGVHCWREQACQTRTWNLSSFILQVRHQLHDVELL